ITREAEEFLTLARQEIAALCPDFSSLLNDVCVERTTRFLFKIIGAISTSPRRIFSDAEESTRHRLLRIRSEAHPHPEQNWLSSFSANSRHRDQGSPVCNARREIRRAWPHPERSLGPVAACCKAGARKQWWYSPTASGRSG